MDGKWECGQKNECGQINLSVLSTTVGVECGVWSVECDSAVSGEPPQKYDRILDMSMFRNGPGVMGLSCEFKFHMDVQHPEHRPID